MVQFEIENEEIPNSTSTTTEKAISEIAVNGTISDEESDGEETSSTMGIGLFVIIAIVALIVLVCIGYCGYSMCCKKKNQQNDNKGQYQAAPTNDTV